MKIDWIIWSPRNDVPAHGDFKSLTEVRQFLRAQKLSIHDDQGWVVREMKDGNEIAKCNAAILVSDQGAEGKTILALTISG